MNRRAILTYAIASALMTREAIGQCDATASSSSERFLVRAPPIRPDEYYFYYRLPSNVVYIPAETLIGYFEGKLRALEIARRIELELPLRRHTDVFTLFLEDRFIWKALDHILADVLEKGEASVWHVEEGFVGEIEVERYVEKCVSGRKFRHAGQGHFYEVIDGVA